MRIDFQPAFAVEVKHEYYPDGISADFRIVPTLHSQQQLQNYGLLFKELPGGFVVLYETTGGAGSSAAKRKIEEPLALSFLLEAKSPFLLNYSNLPLDKSADQIFFLSNRRKNLNAGKRLLSADPLAEFISQTDLLALRAQRFQVERKTDQSSAVWQLFDAQGTLLHRERVQSVAGLSSYRVDLATRQPGVYQLLHDGVTHLQFYAADRLLGEYPFGLLEIAADPSVTDEFSFVDGSGNPQFRRYQIKLQARKTTWEYFVVAKYETQLKPQDLSVTLEDPAVDFARQAAVELADGSRAIPFIADKPLPLTRRPLKGIALHKKKGPTTPKLEIVDLPNPSITEVIPVTAEKVVSRVYVYV